MNRTELKKLHRSLTIANAGVTALATGFAHDGKRLPNAEDVLKKALESAVEAGRQAEALLTQIRQTA